MLAYVSDISKEDLIKKREEYWNTRVEGDIEIWNTLRMVCDEDTSEGNNIYINA